MSHQLIRHDINYGEVDVTELAGIRFVVASWRLPMLNLQPVQVSEIPQFSRELELHVQLGNGGNVVICHILDRRDVRPLAAALSLHTGLTVYVQALQPAILAVYKDGQLQGEIRRLDHFYTGLTAEQLEGTTF